MPGLGAVPAHRRAAVAADPLAAALLAPRARGVAAPTTLEHAQPVNRPPSLLGAGTKNGGAAYLSSQTANRQARGPSDADAGSLTEPTDPENATTEARRRDTNTREKMSQRISCRGVFLPMPNTILVCS